MVSHLSSVTMSAVMTVNENLTGLQARLQNLNMQLFLNTSVLRNSSCAPPSKLNIILCAAAEFKIKYYAPGPKFIFLITSRTWKSWERPPQRVARGPFFLVDKRDCLHMCMKPLAREPFLTAFLIDGSKYSI